jgi:hypothetical protein
MSEMSEQRHRQREAVAAAIHEFSVKLAQNTETEPLLLVESLVLATATACVGLAQEGKRREAIVGAAEMLLQFSHSDAPWMSQELKKDH